MDMAQQIKGLELPEAVSFEQRYGFGPWDAEDEGSKTNTNKTRGKKGDWINKAGEVIQVLPDLYCTFFPKNCRAQQRGNQTPIVVQQAANQRDWLTVSLLVVVVLVLLILIFKK